MAVQLILIAIKRHLQKKNILELHLCTFITPETNESLYISRYFYTETQITVVVAPQKSATARPIGVGMSRQIPRRLFNELSFSASHWRQEINRPIIKVCHQHWRFLPAVRFQGMRAVLMAKFYF